MIRLFLFLLLLTQSQAQTLESVLSLSSRVLDPATIGPEMCTVLPSCSERFLGDPSSPGSICHELGAESAPLVQNTFSDGSKILNPVAIDRCNNLRMKNLPQTEPEFDSLVAPLTDPEKIARVQATIDDLKRAMVSQITQSEPLTSGQRYLLEKLETMEVTFDAQDPGCLSAPFNASYAQNLNVMNICPLLAHQSPESYAALIAHELGHLADPCNSYHDRYNFSRTLTAETFSRQINECLTDVPAEERESFTNWATGNSRMHAQALIFYTREGISERRRLADRLVNCGIVSGPANPAPRTFEGNPYVEISSCVSQRHLDNGQRIGAQSLVEEGTSCQTGSRQREIMADYIGSAVTVRYLNSRPRSPGEKSGSLLNFFVAMQCASEKEGPEYLSANDRMTVYLQQPEIQEALGCGGEVPQMLCPVPESLR